MKPATFPPPLFRIQTIERVLNRHTAINSPEARLAVAVITRAIDDCLSQSPAERAEARRFIQGPRLETWTDLIGLQPWFVRAIARDAGYLAEMTKARSTAKRSPATPLRKEPIRA